jgi:hypothetical protein
MGIRQPFPALNHIVGESGDAGLGYVGVASLVPGFVEEGVGVAELFVSVGEVVGESGDAGLGYVGVVGLIPRITEEIVPEIQKPIAIRVPRILIAFLG